MSVYYYSINHKDIKSRNYVESIFIAVKAEIQKLITLVKTN